MRAAGPTPEITPEQRKKNKRINLLFLFGIIGSLLLVYALKQGEDRRAEEAEMEAYLSAPQDTTGSAHMRRGSYYGKPACSEDMQRNTAIVAVRKKLRSPSTAEFNYLDGKFGRNGDQLTYHNYVDAQNAFGAMIRTQYMVFMICDAKGLHVDNVIFEEP